MTLSALTDRLSRALLAIAALWAFALAFYILADVIGRGLLGRPLVGTPEIVRNSIVMIALLQAPYAVRSGAMLRADFILNILPKVAQRAVNGAGYLLAVAVFGALVWGSLEPAIEAWQRNEFDGMGAVQVPVWPVRWAMVFTGAIVVVNYLLLAWREFRPPLPGTEDGA